jgi:hypothetical protein
MVKGTQILVLVLSGFFTTASIGVAQQNERPMPNPGRQPGAGSPPGAGQSAQPGGRRLPPGEGSREFPPGPRGERTPPGDFGPAEGPPGFPRGGGRAGPPLPRLEMQRLEQEDPEMYTLIVQDEQLERDTLQAAGQLRRAPAGEREKLKKGLSDLVNKHFDVRQERRELQLKRMEEELKRLREAIAKRNEERQAIIDRRLSELVGEEKDLEF